jgi:ethanolamine ammonia-lyase small subunit
MTPDAIPDSWKRLRRFTNARIAIGRAGGSVPTGALLDFRLAHARARDALLRTLDEPAFVRALQEASGLPVESCSSAAPDLGAYLGRPDLGRQLSTESSVRLAALQSDPPTELVIVISDGLSSLAVENHAAAVLAELVPGLMQDGWTLAPVVFVRRGRVAVQDAVGTALGASHALILLGERPGLGTPDSLGAYLVHQPHPDNTDARRNCVSNIHAAGLRPPLAAAKLRWLLNESRRRKLSGVDLKDESDRLLVSPATA